MPGGVDRPCTIPGPRDPRRLEPAAPDVPRALGRLARARAGGRAQRLAERGGRGARGHDRGDEGTTALATLLGHKGDLMLVHFRRELRGAAGGPAPGRAAGALARYPRAHHLLRLDRRARHVRDDGADPRPARARRASKPGSPEFEKAFDAEMEEQRRRVVGPALPGGPAAALRLLLPHEQAARRDKNWYAVPVEERAPHDARPRRDRPPLRGPVTQIISGSIGFDDWEWGVDLFADDPVVFKKLIYEMRFDEASRLVRGVRPVLHRPAVLARPSCRGSSRARSRRCSGGELACVRH